MNNSIINQIKNWYSRGGIVEKLITVNVIIFVFTYFIVGISGLFKINSNPIFDWFSLSSDFHEFISKPWSIVTYGFLHNRFFHLFFNLLYLNFIGRLFLEYFIPRKLLNFYLMGTICGGALFMISFNYFPLLQNSRATLYGASAGVMAIMIGITTHIPNYQLKLPLVGFVKLWVIAAIFIGVDLISLIDNTGGRFAHLGGALYGFLAVYYQGYFKFKNPFKNIFQKKTSLKTSYKSSKPKKTKTQKSSPTNQQKIDAILDKISKSGYDSLSKQEKEFLFQQGKK